MRRLIQSRSVVQRKSLSSFYHSSLSSLFSLPFCCFLSHFQPPIIPSLPHLLALLPHPCPMCPPSSSHLRLSVCRLPICMSVFWLCGRHPVRICCAHAHVFVPARMSACIWVVVKKPAWLKCVFCVIFCSSVLLSSRRLAVVGNERKKQNKKTKNTPNEFFKNNLSVLSGCEKSWLFWSIARPKPGCDFFTTPNQCILTHVGARSLTHAQRKPLCDFLSCGFRFSNKRRVVSAAPSASHWAPYRFLQQQKTFWEALCAWYRSALPLWEAFVGSYFILLFFFF